MDEEKLLQCLDRTQSILETQSSLIIKLAKDGRRLSALIATLVKNGTITTEQLAVETEERALPSDLCAAYDAILAKSPPEPSRQLDRKPKLTMVTGQAPDKPTG